MCLLSRTPLGVGLAPVDVRVARHCPCSCGLKMQRSFRTRAYRPEAHPSDSRSDRVADWHRIAIPPVLGWNLIPPNYSLPPPPPPPFRLRRYLPRRALLRELGRVVATSIARRVTLRRRSRTALTVCANRDVARALRRMSPSVVETQVALDEVPIPRLKAHRRTQAGSSPSASPSVRRAIFVARLAWKGPYLALAALRRMPRDSSSTARVQSESASKRRSQKLTSPTGSGSMAWLLVRQLLPIRTRMCSCFQACTMLPGSRSRRRSLLDARWYVWTLPGRLC